MSDRQTEPQPGGAKILLRVLFLAPLLIFAGTMIYLFAGLDPERDPSAIPSARVGKPAPEVALAPIPGGDTPGFSTADLAGEGLQAVNVFASWCVPCRAEHPLITRLAEEEGVPVNGVNYKDEAEAALAWLDELGNPYSRIGYDADGRAGLEWSITGVPETFLIDGEGTVVWHHQGPLTAQTFNEEVLPLIESHR